jgi:MtN3 and saliva related transmembrane protein
MLMLSLTSVTGFVAACCTTVSYFPQLKKCIDTGTAEDLSLKMLSILAVGIALWVVYGILRHDWVIIIANSVSLLLLAALLAFKLNEIVRGRRAPH